jgi:hypothetical protein
MRQQLDGDRLETEPTDKLQRCAIRSACVLVGGRMGRKPAGSALS